MEILQHLKTCRKGLHKYSSKFKQCPECKKAYALREDVVQKNKERTRKWVEQNRERTRINARKWAEENKDKRKEYNKKYRKTNKQKIKKYKPKPETKRAYKAKYRAAKKQALASWADIKKIREIYQECIRITKETGIEYQVDHIYPLSNKYLCGLHVENNLQIITKEENLLKSNKTWPGQLPCQTE